MAHLVISLELSEYEEQKLVKIAYSQRKSVSVYVTDMVKTTLLNADISTANNQLEIELDKP